MIRLQSEPFDPAAELAAFVASVPGAGAVTSFVGLVRSESGAVSGLELDHYPALTLSEIERIADEARARFDLIGLVVVHRCGALAPGEPIVFVAAAAPHRRAAFDAVDHVMDRLKTEAPIWKCEHGPDGPRWIEPSETDVKDRARW